MTTENLIFLTASICFVGVISLVIIGIKLFKYEKALKIDTLMSGIISAELSDFDTLSVKSKEQKKAHKDINILISFDFNIQENYSNVYC